MSKSIAQQLALVFMGRTLDTQWASSTANLLNGSQPSVALQGAFYNAAVAEGVFSTSDSPSGLVNDIFQNIFGFGASTFEQTAWGNLITNGTITKETAAWTIFKSYLGATNVPDAYKLPAQSKLVAMDAYSTELAADAAANLALAGGGTAATTARAYVSGVTSQASAATAIAGVAASVDALTVVPGTTYTLTSSAASVNEGGAINFTLAATNVAAGTQQAYTITGVNSADVVGGSLSGVATIGADGKATISVTLVADAVTEGAETLTVSVAGKTASATVNDTSIAPVPTYALAADAASVNEGGTAIFRLTTTNVAAGSKFDYTLAGVSAADVVGGLLAGTATVGTDGKAIVEVQLAADALTEGAETLTMAVAGQSAAVTVADTSTTPIPTYALAADAASVNEGGTAIFRLTTTNVAAGSKFDYTLAGVSAADVVGGLLAGTATVGTDGKAIVEVQLAADALTEGAETLTMAVAGQSAAVTVADTSTTPIPTYALAADAASVNEGGTAMFTLTTTNVAAGSTFAYTLSGVSAADVLGGSLTGTATVDANGKANVGVTLLADVLSEGAETLTITMANQTVNTTVVDTSTSSFTLTAGADFGAAFTGTSQADTFVAGEVVTGGLTTTTFTVGDTLDGGTGTDTLIISQTAAFAVPVSTSVTSIENVNITSGGIVTINTVTGVGGFSGLAALNTTSVAGLAATTAATVDVNATVSALAGVDGGIAIQGGRNITLAVSSTNNPIADSAPEIVVGSTTAPAGTVTVTSSLVGVNTAVAGDIAVTGGTTVSVTQSLGNAVNTTNTQGNVAVTGTATTTAVTVIQDAAATAAATVVGKVNGSVEIIDVNNASTTAAGTITSATVSNYTSLVFQGSALTTLSLTGGSSNIIIGNGNLTTPTNRTLGVTVNGLTGGTLDDADIYTTLNVTTAGANSTLANVTFGAATALNVAGVSALTLSSIAGLGALTSVTSTSSANLTIGSNIGTGVSFTGGSGVDTISLAATGTKTISTGGGNDSVTYGGALGTGGTVDAGDGTADTLIMTAAQAVTATASTAFAATVSNFEVLRLSAATGAAAAINMANADGINSLSIAGATVGALTVTNAAADFTLTQRALTSFASSVALKTATGTADNVNLVYTATDGFTNSAAFTIADVENLVITTDDTDEVAATQAFVSILTAAAVKSVTITGDAGFDASTGLGATTLTSLNASGLTASGAFGGLTFTSGALAASSVITGSAAGTNTINLNAATTASTFVTYTGGTGSDVIASTNALNNVFTLGNGGNSINAGGAGASDGNNTVTAGTGNDTIRLGNGNNIIDVGAGTNLVQLGNGNNTITGGTGADTVDVGTGSNTIVVGGGTSVNSVTVGAAAGLNTITTTSTGVDTFVLGGIQVAGGFYSSLNGWAAGDVIDFALVTASASTVSPLGAKITLGAAASFANYLDAAAISTTANTVAAVIKWFNYGSNTYIVVDNGDLGSFTDGLDSVVELVGTYNLSTSTVAADVLTFV